MDLAEVIAGVPAYAFQSAILLVAGLLLPELLYYTKPNTRVLYYRSLLFMVIFFPLLGLWWTSTNPSVLEMEMVVSFKNITDYVLSGSKPSVSVFPFIIVYGLISLFFLSRVIAGLIVLKRLQRRTLPYQNSDMLTVVQAALGCKAEVRISDRIRGPVTFGWLHPTILLPMDFDSFDRAQRRAILLHELLHVCRRDWLFGIIDEVIRSVFWIHPVVWILHNRVVLWREKAVDLGVIRLTKQPMVYLKALKNFAQRQQRQIKLPVHTLTIDNHLLRRMKFLIQGAYKSGAHMTTALPVLMLSVSLVGFFGAMVFPLLPSKAEVDIRVIETRGKRMDMQSFTTIAPRVRKTVRRPSKISLSTLKQTSKQPILSEMKDKLKSELEQAREIIASSRKDLLIENALLSAAELQLAKLQPKVEPETSPTSLDERIIESAEADKTETHSVSEPKLVYSVHPVYETLFLEKTGNRNVTEEVVVSININAQGRVTDVKQISASDKRLYSVVAKATRKWRFMPAMVNGKHVNAKKLYKIKFVPEYADNIPVTGSLIRPRPRRIHKKVPTFMTVYSSRTLPP